MTNHEGTRAACCHVGPEQICSIDQYVRNNILLALLQNIRIISVYLYLWILKISRFSLIFSWYVTALFFRTYFQKTKQQIYSAHLTHYHEEVSQCVDLYTCLTCLTCNCIYYNTTCKKNKVFLVKHWLRNPQCYHNCAELVTISLQYFFHHTAHFFECSTNFSKYSTLNILLSMASHSLS